MRRALVALVLAAAAASTSGAAAGRGIGLSASPLRLTLDGASGSVVTVWNPGRRTLLVDVSRAGLRRSLRGGPRVRPARGAANWLRVRPRRFRLAPGAKRILHVVAAPSRRAAFGDHQALVLLATHPLGVRRVRVRLRVGVVVVLRVRGQIVRSLDVRSVSVRARGSRRLLDVRLVNRGNVTERLGGRRLRLGLRFHGRTVATLRARSLELLPHSAGIATFVYRGRVRGRVLARLELGPPFQVPTRAFRIRL